uniref:UDP-N-acetylmuramoyl-L-alanyl-D-glutamate--2,6-diaminopimelate ligase n=1 Tax=Magnetococcus massalia (strain MO-1) TaxID=451514 RepID=A0A1S7LJG8_MAGMO|nr:UDP-N-acetylmuramoyl-L-alanyl-D-glutamate--2, 6-diaminopimelate ligase [Candidatus Magnetococcus massalia]
MSTTLGQLIQGLPELACDGSVATPLQGITLDSRQAGKGILFAALPGSSRDGRDYIPAAIEAGSRVILHDGRTPLPHHPGLISLSHPNPRQLLGQLCARFYDHPEQQLRTIAVTGTNGKTTVAGLCAAILEHLGQTVGLLGTNGSWIAGKKRPANHTTPDATTLYPLLREMVDAGCQWLVMEASSHALDQHRMEGITPAAALFTNLTRDHLDYHGDMEHYFQAKAKLFSHHQPELAVLPTGTPWAERLQTLCQDNGIRTLTSSQQSNGADLTIKDLHCSMAGSRFSLCWQGQQAAVALQTPGHFNVENALLAATALLGLGFSLPLVAEGLNHFTGVAGRMQRIDLGQPYAVVVDYAHTPDALERLLQTAQQLTPGQIHLLVGCGGDRDRGKRPLMGAIAAQRADHLVVTDDNPRSEDPAQIRREVLAGCREGQAHWVEIADRADAIKQLIRQASAGDSVIIAGKGHEKVQISAAGSQPFDDVAVATQAIQSMQGS